MEWRIMSYFDVDRRTAGLMQGASLTASIGSGPGEKATGEYIVSGIPFVSSSTFNATNTYEMNFPAMTQWIYVRNLDASTTVKFGFTETGIGANQYWTVKAGTISPKIEVRTKSIFINGTDGDAYEVMASLTDIMTGSIPSLEASTYWGI